MGDVAYKCCLVKNSKAMRGVFRPPLIESRSSTVEIKRNVACGKLVKVLFIAVIAKVLLYSKVKFYLL